MFRTLCAENLVIAPGGPEALPFGRLWYGEPNAAANAIGYAEHDSRSHDAVIRVYDALGTVIETHEHEGDFKERLAYAANKKPPCIKARRLIGSVD